MAGRIASIDTLTHLYDCAVIVIKDVDIGIYILFINLWMYLHSLVFDFVA